jgi:hypothetical protein
MDATVQAREEQAQSKDECRKLEKDMSKFMNNKEGRFVSSFFSFFFGLS